MSTDKTKKSQFPMLVTILVVIDIAVYFFGHFVLSGIYEGRFFKGIIEGQSQHDLSFYLDLFDKFFLICNGLGWLGIFYTKFVCDLIKAKHADIKEYFRNDSQALFRWIKSNQAILMSGLLLSMIFFVLYFYIGIQFGKTPAFLEEDLIYGLDPKRTISNNADYFAYHNRTLVHPIYVLLINPWGALINLFMQNVLMSALIINSLFAAMGVFLALIIFYLFTKDIVNAVLITVLYGFSMSQLCIGSFPDTMAVAVCSLLLTYLLFYIGILNNRIYFAAWIPVGILTLGITITNIVQTMICLFLLLVYYEKGKLKLFFWFKTLSLYVVSVVLGTAVLSVLQKIIWFEAELFFMPKGYGAETLYIKSTIFNAPVKVIAGLLKTFYMTNITGAVPDIYSLPERISPLLTFQTSFKFTLIGYVTTCVWAVGLLLAFGNIIRRKKNLKFYAGALLCNLFVLTLHSVYGADEMYIYTGTFTFLLCTYLLSLFEAPASLVRGGFLVFIPLTLFNNLVIVSRMLSVFQ